MLKIFSHAGFAPGVVDAQTPELTTASAGLLGDAVRESSARTTAAAAGGGHVPSPFTPASADRVGLAVPILVDEQVVAVLYADDDGVEGREVPSAWPERVELLARHAGRCLEALTARSAARARAGHPVPATLVRRLEARRRGRAALCAPAHLGNQAVSRGPGRRGPARTRFAAAAARRTSNARASCMRSACRPTCAHAPTISSRSSFARWLTAIRSCWDRLREFWRGVSARSALSRRSSRSTSRRSVRKAGRLARHRFSLRPRTSPFPRTSRTSGSHRPGVRPAALTSLGKAVALIADTKYDQAAVLLQKAPLASTPLAGYGRYYAGARRVPAEQAGRGAAGRVRRSSTAIPPARSRKRHVALRARSPKRRAIRRRPSRSTSR